MRYRYVGTEPCRVGTVMVTQGMELSLGTPPNKLWEPIWVAPPKAPKMLKVHANRELDTTKEGVKGNGE